MSKPPENAYIKQIFEVITFCFDIQIEALIILMKLQCSVFYCNRWNFVQGFSNVAEELGLKVGLKHKKINISNPRVRRYAWKYRLC